MVSSSSGGCVTACVCSAAELLFSPSIVGIDQCGIAEAIEFMLNNKFTEQEQQRLVQVSTHSLMQPSRHKASLYQGLSVPASAARSMYFTERKFPLIILLSLQCFDAVGWAAGRASSL